MAFKCHIMIKNKAIKILSVFLLLIICLTSFILPNASAATKYNYIANGEKNILGFKISNIVQIDECTSIDITMSSSKNIVEFSNYQKVKLNGVEYDSGNHSIDSTKNVTFTFDDIVAGATISPIIIYVEKIENTSCPLIITHKKDDVVIEEVKLTLSATFYSNEPSDIVNNKENTSGSLTQEDVIISRPKEEKPIEKPEVTPPKEENNNNNNNNNNSNNDNNNDTQIPEQPNEDTNQNQGGQTTTPEQPEIQDPNQTENEIQLPIINENATADKENSSNSGKPSSKPIQDEDIIDDDKSFLDFINNIDKTLIIGAIIIVSVILIVVIILIVLSSKKKNKTKEPELEVVSVAQPEIEASAVEQPIVENPFINEQNSSQNTIVEEPMDEYSPIPVFEETVNTINFEENNVLDATMVEDEMNNVSNNQTENTIEETNEQSVKQEENIPIIEEKDIYETLLNATFPKEELEKLKSDFENTQSIDDSENEYSNIIQ